MRELVKLPDQVLRQKSAPIKNIDSKIKALAEELIELMSVNHHGQIAVGIAAPQMGELVRMFAYRANPYSEVPATIVVVNPELIYAKGFHLVTESCLSIPGKSFTLRRAKIAKIRGLTLDGVERSFRGRDLVAQIFQHEIDHLNGVLIDEIGKIKRR